LKNDDPACINTQVIIGWYLPPDDEWDVLIYYLGGYEVAGGAMKETGTVHWKEPNPASNSSGFTALPGGGRELNGEYATIGRGAFFTSSTPHADSLQWAWQRTIPFNYEMIVRFAQYKQAGQSVRCVKD
jgi:uncharacterized protein (TIGR02145 family)